MERFGLVKGIEAVVGHLQKRKSFCDPHMQTSGQSGRRVFEEKLNKLRSELTNVIIEMTNQNTLAEDNQADVQRVVRTRDLITWVIEKVLINATYSTGIMSALDGAHLLNRLFLGLSEDGLKKYLDGDHSEVSVFKRPNLNNLITKAQKVNATALKNGTVLSCPAN